MSKTRYIKGKDGKFAGSIGSGKTSVPSSSPQISNLSTPADTGLSAYHIDTDDVMLHIADEFDQFPDFTNPDASLTDTLFSAPPLADRASWPVVDAQRTIDADSMRVINQIAGLNTPEPLDPITGEPEPFDNSDRQHQIAMTSWFADFYGDYAQQLWDKGHHRQATAYFTLSQLSHQAADTAGNNADALRNPEAEADVQKMNLVAVQQAIREAATGAVIMDYLPHCGWDPDAAATLAYLDGNPHLNK